MERTQILEEIGKMTVLELSQLIKDMEEKFGVSAAAAVAVAAPAAAGGGAAKAEEKTKDLVDGAPKAVKEGVAKADAEAVLKKLIDAGAKAEIK